jgi:hypothetical protein
MVKDNDVKFVDFRFTDTRGKWQHITVPVSQFDESKFEEGQAFDGSSIAGWKGIEASDMLLIPDPNTANLDPFFEEPGEFLIIHDYKRPWRVTGNSSVYRFKLGAHPEVLDYFRNHVEEVRTRFRNEQAYLSDFLHKQGKLSYWDASWCPSFKYHGIPTWPTNYWKAPFVPKGARIVIFHGECNPPDALAGKRNRRFRFIKPARWVADHWHE